MKPLVSVLIPSYNHEAYIKETIQSVLDQTYQNFEIIINDDCSTDRTVEIIQSFQDPRITLTISKKNQGQFASTNTCVKKAKGEYLCFLNSDDSFHPNKLERQVAYLQNNTSMAAVFTRPELIDENGKQYRDKNHFYFRLFNLPHLNRYKLLHFLFFEGNYFCHPSVMIRTSVQKEIGPYNELFAQISDMDYWVRVALKYEMGMIEKPLTKFRIRKGEENMSGNKPSTRIRSFIEWKYILKYYLKIKSNNELVLIFPEIKQKYTRFFEELIPFYIALLCFDSAFSSHNQFGLDILYDLLNNPKTAQMLNNFYNFTNLDFIRIAGKTDLYNYGNKEYIQNDVDKKLLERILKSKFYKVWELYHKV